MTTIGQTADTGGTYHLNTNGLADCGAGPLDPATVIPASDARGHGHTCRNCGPGIRRDLTLTEAQEGAPRGYKLKATRTGFAAAGPFGTGWTDAGSNPFDLMRSARLHRGQVVRAQRAAKAEADRRAAERAAAASFYCRGCGRRLSDFDLTAAAAEGLCFDCA